MTPNVGVVYDGSIRDNGTPLYVRGALAGILGRDPEWWSEGAAVPVGVVDFLIHVDDGRDDLPVSGLPHPWGYWIIDSHLGPDVRLTKAKFADTVWCAQLPFVQKLEDAGIKASWLPLACMPEAHPTAAELSDPVPLQGYDLAFVGHLMDPATSDRVAFLDQVFRAFPDFWFAYNCYHEDMARVYHRARIGLNHAVRDDLNMRFFELASIGVPQLCDSRMVGLDDLGFRPFEHFLPYTSIDEAVAQIQAALRDPELLHRIAGAALALVRSRHTYRHRVEQMLADAAERGFL